MERGPVVLLGQGEQYADPDDWRELIRARRIRRGVELAVRRDGLTTLQRPEEVSELASVLDQIDPPGLPSQVVPVMAAATSPARTPGVPVSSPAASTAPLNAGASASAAPPPKSLPTAAPRKRWGFGLWLGAFALGVLLLLRLCAPDGLPPLPAFGTRAQKATPPVDAASAAACARPRGWIAKAACDDPDFAKLRPAMAKAYAARLAGASGDARTSLIDDQARWQGARSACRTASDAGACLVERYRARLAELQPRAEAARAVEAPWASPPLPPPAAVAVVDRPDWVRRPGPDEVADAYPERALRLEVDGRALLSCRATATGALSACDIVSKDPPDYGFGGAALRLSRFYAIRPLTAEGRPVEGAKVDVPVAFRGG